MLKVAITGNIAAGKSQVEKIIANNFPVYDADKIAHEILGNVDRKALGAKVFADPKARKELEEYIHPKVKEKILEIFKSYTPSPRERPRRGEVGVRVNLQGGQIPDIVFISIPLLFETGFDEMFDKIIFVAADDNIRLERLMKRNNLSEEEALLRMNSQGAQEEKILKSDYIVYNNSSLSDLEEEINKILKEI